MLVLSIIGIIYGALVCMMQKDMKKLIAPPQLDCEPSGLPARWRIFALTPNVGFREA